MSFEIQYQLQMKEEKRLVMLLSVVSDSLPESVQKFLVSKCMVRVLVSGMLGAGNRIEPNTKYFITVSQLACLNNDNEIIKTYLHELAHFYNDDMSNEDTKVFSDKEKEAQRLETLWFNNFVAYWHDNVNKVKR